MSTESNNIAELFLLLIFIMAWILSIIMLAFNGIISYGITKEHRIFIKQASQASIRHEVQSDLLLNIGIPLESSKDK
ncbi:hypothetical protein DERF_011260 [Dermatophagoides farinae]|uniref:Uncharacterized protein n=1 Tax=Dermatophagoides farinae TaxID=6954 RepID=A0A922HSK8_DERFA|nr:hypothetical protein DERF_011260 [Dermatophagoides farinae]